MRVMGRFGVVPAAWLDRDDIGMAEIAVLACLSTYADENGWCYPSQGTIARQIGKSRSTVNAIIKRLVATGLVEQYRQVRHDGGETSSTYRIRYDIGLAPSPTGDAPPDRGPKSSGDCSPLASRERRNAQDGDVLRSEAGDEGLTTEDDHLQGHAFQQTDGVDMPTRGVDGSTGGVDQRTGGVDGPTGTDDPLTGPVDRSTETGPREHYPHPHGARPELRSGYRQAKDAASGPGHERPVREQPERPPNQPSAKRQDPPSGRSMVPDDWRPSAADIAWALERYPSADLEALTTRFILMSQAQGWTYANHGSAWRLAIVRYFEEGEGKDDTRRTDRSQGRPPEAGGGGSRRQFGGPPEWPQRRRAAAPARSRYTDPDGRSEENSDIIRKARERVLSLRS
jgi:hypothetical protein